MATETIPPPQDADSPPKQAGFGKVANSPNGGWSLKSLKVAKGDHVTSVGMGVKAANFPPISQRVVLARNLFIKTAAGVSYLPYCSVKVCLPLSYEAVRMDILLI